MLTELQDSIADTLDARRRALGLTIEDLAGRVGTSHTEIRRIVNAQPLGGCYSLRTLCRIADALDLRVEVTLTALDTSPWMEAPDAG
jgi:transcriptional regulator with XRE-family HTH domain